MLQFTKKEKRVTESFSCEKSVRDAIDKMAAQYDVKKSELIVAILMQDFQLKAIVEQLKEQSMNEGNDNA